MMRIKYSCRGYFGSLVKGSPFEPDAVSAKVIYKAESKINAMGPWILESDLEITVGK